MEKKKALRYVRLKYNTERRKNSCLDDRSLNSLLREVDRAGNKKRKKDIGRLFCYIVCTRYHQRRVEYHASGGRRIDLVDRPRFVVRNGCASGCLSTEIERPCVAMR